MAFPCHASEKSDAKLVTRTPDLTAVSARATATQTLLPFCHLVDYGYSVSAMLHGWAYFLSM